jgi:hypothetical protein
LENSSLWECLNGNQSWNFLQAQFSSSPDRKVVRRSSAFAIVKSPECGGAPNGCSEIGAQLARQTKTYRGFTRTDADLEQAISKNRNSHQLHRQGKCSIVWLLFA